MKYCPKCSAALVHKRIDGRERLCCSDTACGYVFWNNPVPVVAIVAEMADGIVLAHPKLAPAGIFSVITGFLESGEIPEHAAIRELKEELGLDAEAVSFIGVYAFEKANQVVMAYHIKASGNIKLNEELDEYRIVAHEQLYGWTETGKFEVGEWLKRLNEFE